MQNIHGGDIYRNKVNMDFSVNINPLGIPKRVKEALIKAVDLCDRYPDIYCEKLIKSISDYTGEKTEKIICSNGASELFLAIVNALKPKNILIPIPSFFGYEKACTGKNIVYYQTSEENDFNLEENFLNYIDENIDMIFLANPNNPTGAIINRDFIIKIAKKCNEVNTVLVIDECFIEFTGIEHDISILKYTNIFKNVIVVRAFTKIYAIPGVRLGYLVCGNDGFIEKIKNNIPEWNVSVFAQEAGCAALNEKDYIIKTVEYVKNERIFLYQLLDKYKIKYFKSYSNFILIKSNLPLYDELLKNGILIRDCSNFKGLEKGYYRMAVKKHEENILFLEQLGRITENE